MVNKQLVDYIKKSEAQGYTEQQLRQYLAGQGYNQKDIQDAITYIQKPETKESILKPKYIVAIGIVLIIIASSVVLYSMLGVPNDEVVVDQHTTSPQIVEPQPNNQQPVTPPPPPPDDQSGNLVPLNPEGKEYKIRYPDKWDVQTEIHGSDIALASPKEYDDDPFIENINIAREELTVDISLADYFNLKKGQLENAPINGFEWVSSETISLNGIEMQQIVHLGEFSSMKIKTMNVFFIKNRTAYVIAYSAEEGSYDKFLVEANKVINSFEFVSE